MMADMLIDEDNEDNTIRASRPSLEQMKAVVEFMEKHPDLVHRSLRYRVGPQKYKKLWLELSKIVNSIDGAVKSTKGWIRFWADKRRSTLIKQKNIEDGKSKEPLSLLEQKILNLCDNKTTGRRKKGVKQEPYNSDDEDNDFLVDLVTKEDASDFDQMFKNEAEDRQLNIMEKLVDVMEQQATAISQVAQAAMDNSKALERLAEASHIQALAVDRVATSFETITSSVHDVRNALLGIDYTMKKCYSTNGMTL